MQEWHFQNYFMNVANGSLMQTAIMQKELSGAGFK